jgi:hypothetical protein
MKTPGRFGEFEIPGQGASMNLEAVMARLQALETKVAQLDDIEQIKKLQRVYGYYFGMDMKDDILKLFSDNAESIEVSDFGVFLGKEGIRRFYQSENKSMPGNLSLCIQQQGVVDVDSNGKTAKGRWQGFMIGSRFIKGTLTASWGLGTYENEYIKENGTWKFKKILWSIIYRTTFEDGWVKKPDVGHVPYEEHKVRGDLPPTAYFPYPSNYNVPLHWME